MFLALVTFCQFWAINSSPHALLCFMHYKFLARTWFNCRHLLPRQHKWQMPLSSNLYIIRIQLYIHVHLTLKTWRIDASDKHIVYHVCIAKGNTKLLHICGQTFALEASTREWDHVCFKCLYLFYCTSLNKTFEIPFEIHRSWGYPQFIGRSNAAIRRTHMDTRAHCRLLSNGVECKS